MNKFIKLGKRILALFIVVLLNVNTYAAVGANDGSAFVTKAEFDALVNTFNEQMDTYQSGLNSKIDGAIANYLAGLSSVQLVDMSPLRSPEKGVWSAMSDGVDRRDWLEGTMNIDSSIIVVRFYNGNSKSNGGMNIKLQSKNEQSEYHEMCYSRGTTEDKAYFGGYLKRNYSILYYGNTMGGGIFAEYGTGGVWLITTSGSTNSYWHTGSYNATLGFGAAMGDSRNWLNGSMSGMLTIDSSKEEISDLILTNPAAGGYYWFVNDTVDSNNMNRENDQYPAIHVYGKKLKDVVKGTAELRYVAPNNGEELNVQFDDNDVAVNYAQPYHGFSSSLVSYNQLYNPKFGEENINKLAEKDTNVDTISGGAENIGLAVTNGYPIVKLNEGDICTMPVKFDKIGDAWTNIDIWLKAGAFGVNEDVLTTTDANIIKAENVENMITSAYTKAITLDASKNNGQGVLKFTMPKDGYVYMKWSIASNNAAGGGTFYPQDVKVQLAE